LRLHKLDTTAADDPTELPRIDLVFRFWQCDNENQAAVKAHHGASLAKLRSVGWAFTLRKCQFQMKKEYCFASAVASPLPTALAGFFLLYSD
jgi:hypothetical protein